MQCVKRGKTIVLFYDKKLLTLLYTIGIFLHVVTKTIAALAQLVEQRTENPCVPGSIPGGGSQSSLKCKGFFFYGSALFRVGRDVVLALDCDFCLCEHRHFYTAGEVHAYALQD